MTIPEDNIHKIGERFHDHARNTKNSRLVIVFSLTLLYMGIEFFFGYLANSLALIADAGHMLNDVLSIGMALTAISLGQTGQSKKFTFGLKRVEVLSGLLNGLSLLFIAIFVVYEAITRYFTPSIEPVKGNILLITAVGGLIINLLGIVLLRDDAEHSLNVEGAYLHILADTFGSVAAIIAGIVISIWGFYLMDLLVSVSIALLILKSGAGIAKKSIEILLEATPRNINTGELVNAISNVDEVINVHDVHTWTLTNNINLINCHLKVNAETNLELLYEKVGMILESYAVHHQTIQVEYQDCDNSDCSPFKSDTSSNNLSWRSE